MGSDNSFVEDFTRMREEFDEGYSRRTAWLDEVWEECDRLRGERQQFVADLHAGGDIFNAGPAGA